MRFYRRVTPILWARALVAGDTISALKRLDGAGRDPHPKRRTRQAIRDGVVMAIDADA